jgi:hypothetical protein
MSGKYNITLDRPLYEHYMKLK